MSLKQTGVPVAGTLTAAVLPAVSAAVGWRMAAGVTGVVVLVVAIAFMLLYRDAPRSAEATHKFNITVLRNILRNHSLVMTIIWGASFIGFQYVVLSYFMLFLIEELHLSPITAGGMLAISQLSSGIIRIVWGAASDFIFHGRRMVVLVISGFLTVVWFLGASLMSIGVPGIAILLLAIVIGISTLAFHGVLAVLLGELADTGQIGTTLGVASTMYHICMIVIPPIFGYLVDMSGYTLAWKVAAVAAFALTLALLIFGREPQRH